MAAQVPPSEPIEPSHSLKVDVVKKERVLRRETGLSQSSSRTLTAILDPFHDEELAPQGLPDGSVRKTQLLFIRRQVAIETASGDTALHVAILPLNQDVQASAATVQGRLVNNYSATATRLGTVAWAVTAGATNVPWPDNNAGTTWATTQAGALAPDSIDTGTQLALSQFTAGNHRVIGCAFEIENTTPDISMGGACTVYNTNALDTTSTMSYQNGGGFDYISTTLSRAPPGTMAEASLIPNARSWSSKRGCYVVGRPACSDMAWRKPQPMALGLSGDDSIPGLQATGSEVALAGADVGINNQQILLSTNDFTVSGAIFSIPSGATTNQQFLLTARFLVEVAPTIDAEVSLVSAFSAPERDPAFFVALSRALQDMPPGVPIDENFLGEWFDDVVSALADVAPAIGTMIGGPVGGMIGTAAGGVAKMLLPKKKKAQPQPQIIEEEEEPEIIELPKPRRPRRPLEILPVRKNKKKKGAVMPVIRRVR